MTKQRDDRFTILQGDASERLQTFAANYFDACLCDPPYGYTAYKSHEKATMDWEHEDVPGRIPRCEKCRHPLIVEDGTVWDCLYHVLKPGAVLVAASGARLYHRMASRIEAAGFFIMDQFNWIYSGANATGVMEGQRLRPAVEPYVVAWKPKGKVGRRLGKGGLLTDVGFDQMMAAALDLQQPGVSGMFFCGKATPFERVGTDHPTPKPIALCKHLGGLLLHPGAKRIVVPFSGCGSEIAGSLLAGWPEVIGIERERKYVSQAERRIPRLLDEWPKYWEQKMAA